MVKLEQAKKNWSENTAGSVGKYCGAVSQFLSDDATEQAKIKGSCEAGAGKKLAESTKDKADLWATKLKQAYGLE